MRLNGLSRLILAIGFATLALLGGATAAERVVPASEAQVRLSFAPVAKVAGPAVVNVYSTKTIKVASSPLMDDPFFRQFFGGDMPGIGRQRERHLERAGHGVLTTGSGAEALHLLAVGDMAACTLAREERAFLEASLGENGTAIVASIQMFAFEQALGDLKVAMEELAGTGIVS